ncbi:STAS domain-containing protein [Nocardia sp. NPDC051052]|uniref:STAS domain-containing protein n=1 Tax=Nocardia sp. NPDC051052 TaxID=3364322 RepID=UPI0037951E5A
MSAESRALHVHLDQVGSAAVLTVDGEVDAASAPQLRSGIEDALGNKPALLVVDLSSVRFFGSAGLSVLLLAAEASAKGGFRVVASAQVRRPIEVTGLDAVLEVFDNIRDALTSGDTPNVA